MPADLPTPVILQKNKLAGDAAWLILLDVVLPDESLLYLCNNNEDIVFGGNTYTAVPMDIDDANWSSKGERPSFAIKISNVTRSLQAYLEAQDGIVGSSVKMRIVNAGLLTEDYSELEMDFEVLSTESNAFWVTFNLGTENLLAWRLLGRYIADHCRWQFKSAECAYSGASEGCDRTLDACRLLNNSDRFGGFPGLSGGGVRFA